MIPKQLAEEPQLDATAASGQDSWPEAADQLLKLMMTR